MELVHQPPGVAHRNPRLSQTRIQTNTIPISHWRRDGKCSEGIEIFFAVCMRTQTSSPIQNPCFFTRTVARANELSHHVKQTGEAIIDSKLLVAAADASYRRAARLANGNVAQGIDVDEFVSKCISYMRLGAGIAEDGRTRAHIYSATTETASGRKCRRFR